MSLTGLLKAQRNKKRGNIRKSSLDKVDGVGVVLKRLMNKFRSIENIKSSKIEELMTVKGLMRKIAKQIIQKIQ